MMAEADLTPQLRAQLECIVARVSSALLGKQDRIRLALTALLAGGHVLLEDIPGVGKTTLANALAYALGLHARRVQFTSDLLPADLIGASIFQPSTGDFRFQPGPIFTEVLLADEINRASPKAQSALLEAMEERQVSVDGISHPLPDPFFVIATQNPIEQQGVYPLPESQLDRFLLRLSLGYPERAAERQMLLQGTTRPTAQGLAPCLDSVSLRQLRTVVRMVHVGPLVLDHLLDLLTASRLPGIFAQGLSPRAGLGWLAAARAWALLHGRMHVEPEDVRELAPYVTGHRLHFTDPALLHAGLTAAGWLLERVSSPDG
jgi:MoxR-like ATPase